MWALVAALWLDLAITAVALLSGTPVHEVNPLGRALYAELGLAGLAGLKASASLIVLFAAYWVRPRRAVKVLAVALGLYACILLWNSVQLALVL